uniref:DUF4158 domain-containing protein n=1 Tax=Heterorhabditis bacteriophora TaxID=37862 RepID=A0A1I7WZK6_HETBA
MDRAGSNRANILRAVGGQAKLFSDDEIQFVLQQSDISQVLSFTAPKAVKNAGKKTPQRTSLLYFIFIINIVRCLSLKIIVYQASKKVLIIYILYEFLKNISKFLYFFNHFGL